MNNLFFEIDNKRAKKLNQESISEAEVNNLNQERVDEQLEEISDNAYNVKKKDDTPFDPNYIDG